MFKSRRVSRHYMVKKKEKVLSIHHTPFWFVYFMTRKGFLRHRWRAYQCIAQYLEQGKGGFWGGIEEVTADSFWIDYSRETGRTVKQKASRLKIAADLLLRGTNIRNWFFPDTIFQNITKKHVYCLTVSTNEFIQRYKGGR